MTEYTWLLLRPGCDTASSSMLGAMWRLILSNAYMRLMSSGDALGALLLRWAASFNPVCRWADPLRNKMFFDSALLPLLASICRLAS